MDSLGLSQNYFWVFLFFLQCLFSRIHASLESLPNSLHCQSLRAAWWGRTREQALGIVNKMTDTMVLKPTEREFVCGSLTPIFRSPMCKNSQVPALASSMGSRAHFVSSITFWLYSGLLRINKRLWVGAFTSVSSDSLQGLNPNSHQPR